MCANCHFVICQCFHTPLPDGNAANVTIPLVPPNVINFDGRSPEARRIADLERRVVELEERSICFDLYLKDAVRRIDALETVMVAHITRVDIDIT